MLAILFAIKTKPVVVNMHSTVGLTEDPLLKLTSKSPGRSHLCLIQSFVKDVTVRSSRHHPVKTILVSRTFCKCLSKGLNEVELNY